MGMELLMELRRDMCAFVVGACMTGVFVCALLDEAGWPLWLLIAGAATNLLSWGYVVMYSDY